MQEQGSKNNKQEESRQLPWTAHLIPGQKTSPTLAGEPGISVLSHQPGSTTPSGGHTDTLLGLEVLHEVLHVLELSLKAALVGQEPIQLPPQVADVGLKHGRDVAPCRLLILQEAPLGLQHLVLLLQEPHLGGRAGVILEWWDRRGAYRTGDGRTGLQGVILSQGFGCSLEASEEGHGDHAKEVGCSGTGLGL